MTQAIQDIIKKATDIAKTRKITIRVLRVLAFEMGNASVDKVYQENRFWVRVCVGLHPGKLFKTPREAAEYMATSIHSIKELRRPS